MFSRSIISNLLFLIGQRNALTRKLFALTFGPHHRVTAKGHRANSTIVQVYTSNLRPIHHPTNDDAGEQLIEKYFASSMLHRRFILIELSQNFGVQFIYFQNEQAFMNVASALRPHYFRLFTIYWQHNRQCGKDMFDAC
uniref:Uncharacterized protein n=1 Tax=Wuchereria bancrofti TaxID=6293 RepID=A0A1I8EL12_WUCBA